MYCNSVSCLNGVSHSPLVSCVHVNISSVPHFKPSFILYPEKFNKTIVRNPLRKDEFARWNCCDLLPFTELQVKGSYSHNMIQNDRFFSGVLIEK